MRFYARHEVSPLVFEDSSRICLAAEPEAFFLAEVDGRPAGYVFAPARFSRVVRTAFTGGHLMRMACRWITGRYGVGLRPALLAAWNWVLLLRDARRPGLACDARILSIAVSPDFQGRHLGSGLMDTALGYLRLQGVGCVRLEVRPDNAPAVHLYEKNGFWIRGRTRDVQGEWVVMLKEEMPGGAA